MIPVTDGPDAGAPWHYGEPLREQREMVAGRAYVELASREVFSVTGPARLSWLSDLCTQDLNDADGGAACYLLDAEGHITHEFTIIDDGETAWGWTLPGRRTALVEFLRSMKFWTEAEPVERPDLRVCWRGHALADSPHQLAAMPSRIGSGCEAIVTDYDEVDDARRAGQWAYEALRIAAGIPRLDLDLDDRSIPNEVGLYATALDKGCYPGQETVARIHNLGRPPRRLVRLLFDGATPQPGAPILDADRPVGACGSAGQHYELGPIGLGLVKRKVDPRASLIVGGIDAAQEPLVDPEVGEHFRFGG